MEVNRRNRCLLKMYLNARHFEQNEATHPHTWEIGLLIQGLDQASQMEQIQKMIETYLEQYEEKTINDFFPFNILTPSTENIGKVFYKELSKMLEQKGMVLESLQISDNPTKTFILNEYQTYYQDLRKKIEEDIWHFHFQQETSDVLSDTDIQKSETNNSSRSKEELLDASFSFFGRKKTYQLRKKKQRKRLIKILIGLIWGLGLCTAVTLFVFCQPNF